MGDKVRVVGVLSWTSGDGARITRAHAERYGVTFPMWHDGPIGTMSRWSPTTVIFDKAGAPVAWARGDYHFRNPAIHALLDALSK